MLKKGNRLAKDQDIKKVFARGRGFFNPFFTFKYLSTASVVRFTAVVSTKVFKKANKRNRLKRIIREQMRKKLSLLHPGDYVLVLKPLAGETSEANLLKNIHAILENNKFLRHE